MKKKHKVFLIVWTSLLAVSAIGVFVYIKFSTKPVFSMLTSSHKESGEITPSGIGSWFSKITDKEPNDLYPATEAAFYVDLGEPKVAGKEIYYILAISKLGEDKFGIVEKKLKGLNLLYSVKKDKDGYSVNISFKDKASMQKIADELKNSL
ncbi:MAG: hypothetical protein PHE67_09205 [Campylobacterales bacterium]|nr:hypothetical protein [Campylobacterales bacterium]